MLPLLLVSPTVAAIASALDFADAENVLVHSVFVVALTLRNDEEGNAGPADSFRSVLYCLEYVTRIDCAGVGSRALECACAFDQIRPLLRLLHVKNLFERRGAASLRARPKPDAGSIVGRLASFLWKVQLLSGTSSYELARS